MSTAIEATWGRITRDAVRLRVFTFTVLREFVRNRGLLLAGGIAYNALLSLVPLAAIVLLGLSSFVSRARILSVLRSELRFVVPEHVDALLETVVGLLDSRDVIGADERL
jgi:membrane protein